MPRRYMQQKEYFVYILKCSDESFYTGICNNIERRMYEHSVGIDEKCYTWKRRPVELAYVEAFTQVIDALEREKQIKRWSRKKKIALIREDWEELIMLSNGHGSTGSP